jgi:hypothetical protein
MKVRDHPTATAGDPSGLTRGVLAVCSVLILVTWGACKPDVFLNCSCLAGLEADA